MFSLGVLETDAFLDMPLSTQALYFHLNLRADDDGFVGNPKRIATNVGASLDDLKLLVAKRFVLTFEDGVIVIKHWRMHNAIKKDRYTQTNYIENLKQLDIKDNGAYTFHNGAQLEHEWSTDGEQTELLCSADKGKVSIELVERENIKEKETPKKALEAEFEELWKTYPKKQGKTNAMADYIKARKEGVTKEEVEAGLKAYCEYLKANHTDTRYIKNGSTWFHQRCWTDDYTRVKGENFNARQDYTKYDIYD